MLAAWLAGNAQRRAAVEPRTSNRVRVQLCATAVRSLVCVRIDVALVHSRFCSKRHSANVRSHNDTTSVRVTAPDAAAAAAIAHATHASSMALFT